VVLESQAGFGGTWRTHRYPGIRSDSDMYTFGYRFKPWLGKPIATGDTILQYLQEVIDEDGLAASIRYRHVIEHASWSSMHQRWTVTGRRGEAGDVFTVSARFLWMCQGYYRHSRGHTPACPAWTFSPVRSCIRNTGHRIWT
jgi:cation diffusion facilitator CzcD-associated flavoprotein CzcO